MHNGLLSNNFILSILKNKTVQLLAAFIIVKRFNDLFAQIIFFNYFNLC